MPLGVDADGDQALHVDHAAALADLLHQRVDPHERVRAAVQRPVAKLLHPLVQLRGHLADLRLRELRHPQDARASPPAGCSRPAGSRSPPPDASACSERRRCSSKPGKYDPAQLRDRQLDRPGPCVPLPAPVAVARVHPVRRDLPVPRVARHVDVGVHHPLRELPTIARSMSGLADASFSSNCAPGTGTMSLTAIRSRSCLDFASRRIARWPPRITATRRAPARQSHQYRLPHTPLPWT